MVKLVGMMNEVEWKRWSKCQGDEIKIYDGYIRLIRLSTTDIGLGTTAIDLVQPLKVSSNWIAITKSPRANLLTTSE